MKNNDNVTFSNNMETVKKKYTLSGAVIAEMVCSVVLLIALSQPWVKNEVSGESISLIEAGGIAFFYAGVFMFNIILKYFKRSRWMSWVTATVAILMYTSYWRTDCIYCGSDSIGYSFSFLDSINRRFCRSGISRQTIFQCILFLPRLIFPLLHCFATIRSGINGQY